jgi:hypothetical protein
MASTVTAPAPRIKCQEVRFRITANGREFAELKKILATLLKAGRPDFQTRSTIRLVADEAFYRAQRKLLKYGDFVD